MTEKELRDLMSKDGRRGQLLERHDYVAALVSLDDNTLAIRIWNIERNNYIVAYNWQVMDFSTAASVLAWSDNGGNWRVT